MTSATYNNFVQSCFRKIYGMLVGADTRKVKRKQGLALFGFFIWADSRIIFCAALTGSVDKINITTNIFFILILLSCFNLQLLDYPDNPRLSQYSLWISVMSTYLCAPRSYKSTIKNVLHIRFCDNICNFLLRFNPYK